MGQIFTLSFTRKKVMMTREMVERERLNALSMLEPRLDDLLRLCENPPKDIVDLNLIYTSVMFTAGSVLLYSADQDEKREKEGE